MGTAVRKSDTLSKKTLYYALRLEDNSILRVSSEQYNVPGIIGGMIQPILIMLVFMVILSYFIASRLSGNIVNPINALDLEHPEENQTYDEIAPLLIRLTGSRSPCSMRFQRQSVSKRNSLLLQKTWRKGLW